MRVGTYTYVLRINMKLNDQNSPWKIGTSKEDKKKESSFYGAGNRTYTIFDFLVSWI